MRSLLLISLLLCATYAQAQTSLNTYLGTDGTLRVTYTLSGEKTDDFFEQITDALKSGKKVQVSHHVQLEEDGLLGDILASNDYQTSLKYDVLQDMYLYEGIQSNSKAVVKKNVLSMMDFPLNPSEKLVTGDAYIISVEVVLEEVEEERTDNRWKRWLDRIPLPTFTRKKITYEVPYIAR